VGKKILSGSSRVEGDVAETVSLRKTGFRVAVLCIIEDGWLASTIVVSMSDIDLLSLRLDTQTLGVQALSMMPGAIVSSLGSNATME
jgi:hypothetical protein